MNHYLSEKKEENGLKRNMVIRKEKARKAQGADGFIKKDFKIIKKINILLINVNSSRIYDAIDRSSRLSKDLAWTEKIQKKSMYT
jgi:hypothetical protein